MNRGYLPAIGQYIDRGTAILAVIGDVALHGLEARATMVVIQSSGS